MLASAPYQAPVREGKEESEKTQDDLGSGGKSDPVNWHTDATPAILHDTITVTLDPTAHVLVVSGYSGSEYAPYRDFINVGDIHSCEPWLYSACIRQNIEKRIASFKGLE